MSKVISQNRFSNEALDAHNRYRKKHGCPPLELDQKLCDLAVDWAENLASNDRLAYKNIDFQGAPVGQNVMRTNQFYVSGATVTDEWYKESEDYRYNGQFTPNIGHFTQLVWKSTKRIGFGFAIAENGKFYAVANYWPAGNYRNEYDYNVPRPTAAGSYSSSYAPKPYEPPVKNSYEPSERYRNEIPITKLAQPNPSPVALKSYDPPPSAHKSHDQIISSGNSVQDKFIQEALSAHNTYRKKHGVDPLIHNKELSKIAQNYAEYIASLGQLKHSTNTYKGDKLGENIAFFFDSRVNYYPGEKAVDQWYSEIKDYRYRDYQPGTGHFTQVVWKGSREIGLGVAKSKDGSWYAVANYYPAGNFLGSFSENVFRPIY